MAAVRNLTQLEAAERGRLLTVDSYDITLDLTDGVGGAGEHTFRCRTEIRFGCREPGASTFIEAAAASIRSATLNGAEIDISGWSAEKGLTLGGLAETNLLVVDAEFPYSASGQGMHRSVDPADKEIYLYSQFEAADAQRVFACFDQPDLKSVFTWHVTVPARWKVISNGPIDRTEPGPVAGTAVVHFAPSVVMSTYITALCAGPYHEVRDKHDGIDLGIFVRASMAQHLDADDIFLITKQGFDFFHDRFAVRYPLTKYDQLFVPDFNAGAMENFGAITNAELYLFRSAVTDYEYEQRANTILHEMAHMWFGDLVTMRWWDDLWLKESFAEWAATWCCAEATRFADAWTTFLSIRKNWGYRQDQLSSTHPVYTDTPDLEAAEVNFDGITYAKGASVIKQLVAFVGVDTFVAGLRRYFAAHAWGNATFGDLLDAVEEAAGRPVREFAAQWLETAQVNTLRPVIDLNADGTYRNVSITQEAPVDHPTLRTHRIGIGLYDRTGGRPGDQTGSRLVRRERLELEVSGPVTAVPALAGVKVPDLLLLNDDDLTYTKLRFDDRSRDTVVASLSGLDNSLARGLCWSAAWDMVRDAELATRDYASMVCTALPQETNINLITSTLNQLQVSLSFYADPQWAPQGWRQLAETARTAFAAAAAGSNIQLAWVRAFANSARTESDLALLRDWLNGLGVPEGLAIEAELRWTVLYGLVASGGAGIDQIEVELDRDRTANGERAATQARALIPTAEGKAETWRRLTTDMSMPNWEQRALLLGFQHALHTKLTAPYATAFFDVVADVWATRDSEPAQEFVYFGYPAHQPTQATVDMSDAWLANPGQPAALRRLVAEGRDGAVRAIRARARDAQ